MPVKVGTAGPGSNPAGGRLTSGRCAVVYWFGSALACGTRIALSSGTSSMASLLSAVLRSEPHSRALRGPLRSLAPLLN